MMHISESGLNIIKKFEGFSATAYLCPAGYWTIGYGHLLKNKIKNDLELTEKQAELILFDDVADAEKAVLRYIDIQLAQGQFDALVSFTFNLGAGALQRSTLRRKVNAKEHSDVPFQLSRWVWAGGRKLPGLIRRRRAESVLYFS